MRAEQCWQSLMGKNSKMDCCAWMVPFVDDCCEGIWEGRGALWGHSAGSSVASSWYGGYQGAVGTRAWWVRDTTASSTGCCSWVLLLVGDDGPATPLNDRCLMLNWYHTEI